MPSDQWSLIHREAWTFEFGKWTFHECNLKQLLVLKALRVGRRVHQSTSQTPPTRGRSMYAIQNNTSFFGLYELVNECTSPPVKNAFNVRQTGKWL